ncbi:MAG: hypothetical protein VKP62_15180 [Candidatus Sericytochromatia bacterium]|nr:hypothetical protein [Candidatus Sericytochromatia bacterium]
MPNEPFKWLLIGVLLGSMVMAGSIWGLLQWGRRPADWSADEFRAHGLPLPPQAHRPHRNVKAHGHDPHASPAHAHELPSSDAPAHEPAGRPDAHAVPEEHPAPTQASPAARPNPTERPGPSEPAATVPAAHGVERGHGDSPAGWPVTPQGRKGHAPAGQKIHP